MTDTAATVEEVLSSYPPSREGHTQDAVEDDLVDLREWAETAKTMLTELSVDVSNAKHALYNAGAPSVGLLGESGDVHRASPLSLADQVKWLVDNRDWHKQSRDADYKAGRITEDQLQASLEAEARRANAAETNLSELHIAVKQALGVESTAEALEEASTLRARLAAAEHQAESNRTRGLAIAEHGELATTIYQKQVDELESKLAHFVAQRDAEVDQLRTGFMKQRDDAVSDAVFYRQRAEAAGAEVREQQEAHAAAVALHAREIADRDARLDQLEVEVAMLEAHVDLIDEALPMCPDMWADWDLELAEDEP